MWRTNRLSLPIIKITSFQRYQLYEKLPISYDTLDGFCNCAVFGGSYPQLNDIKIQSFFARILTLKCHKLV